MSLKTDLRSLQEGGEPEIHERVDLRAWTALGVGGLGDLLIRCRSADGLQRALDLLAAHGRCWVVLGSGSRMVPSDNGVRVPIINLSGNLGLWELDMEGAVAWSGANLAQVCRAAARTGLGGVDALMTASGTVGGAVHAAQRGHFPLRNILEWADIVRPGSEVERVTPEIREDTSRGVHLDLDRRVVLRARLRLSGEGLEDLRIRLDDGGSRSWQRQPRTAGPVFIGPEGLRADAILAETGCLGMSAGGARLSEAAPNRICTTRTTRSSDVFELTQSVREKVMERTGIRLDTALCFLDDQGRRVEP